MCGAHGLPAELSGGDVDAAMFAAKVQPNDLDRLAEAAMRFEKPEDISGGQPNNMPVEGPGFSQKQLRFR